MSSCLKEKSHKQGLQFLDIQDFPPIFEHVRMFFNQDIAPLYGDQTAALNKIFEGKNYVLYDELPSNIKIKVMIIFRLHNKFTKIVKINYFLEIRIVFL